MSSAIAYIRVSTEQQASEGISLEAQESRIRAWCELNAHQLVAVFVDAGISGKRCDNRPELQKALAAVTACKGTLIVYSLSRLARSTKDTLSISERLERSGADLVSLSEKIDTTSAAGKMVFRMLAVLAEFERDLVSERTTAALQHKKQRGGRMGQIPFGQSIAEDGDTLVINDTEADVIRQVRTLRQQGLTLQAIANHLESQHIPNKSGRVRWNTTQIHRLLARPV